MRAFYLASVGGGGPVNLVLLGHTVCGFVVMVIPALLASARQQIATSASIRVVNRRGSAPPLNGVTPALLAAHTLFTAALLPRLRGARTVFSSQAARHRAIPLRSSRHRGSLPTRGIVRCMLLRHTSFVPNRSNLFASVQRVAIKSRVA